MTQDVILNAGTTVDMQLDDGTWQRVPRLTTFGAIGEQAEAKAKTTIEDRRNKYAPGIQDSDERNIEGQYIPFQNTGDEYYDDYILQQAFIDRCKRHEEFNMRVNWSEDLNQSNSVAEVSGFLYQPLGFNFQDGTQEDWRMFTVNGRQNSVTVFGASISEESPSVAVGADTQLTVLPDPNNMVLSEYEDDIVWTSGDEAIATVDTTGLVSGVAEGTVTITAEIRGVPATVEVTVTAA